MITKYNIDDVVLVPAKVSKIVVNSDSTQYSLRSSNWTNTERFLEDDIVGAVPTKEDIDVLYNNLDYIKKVTSNIGSHYAKEKTEIMNGVNYVCDFLKKFNLEDNKND